MSVYHEVSALTLTDQYTMLGRYSEHPGMVGETNMSYALFLLDHSTMKVTSCTYENAMAYYRSTHGQRERLALWRLIRPASPLAEEERARATQADAISRVI